MAFFCIHCRSEIDSKYKACPYCGEPITDFLRRHLETPLDDKYQILSRLGVGGMGEVYKALHVTLNALRVIKLMRANIATDPGAHERFLREARLATRIHHPAVAALHDFSTLDDGSHYMVWEYIEGTNLHELIEERGPLSPRYAARLAIETLMGLDAIHRAGIVHRDISPENIMIARDDDGEEHVKLIDLGIAKTWGEAGDTATKTGMFVGKWKYCSPEHLGMLDAGERIDGRADLYSFGIVLYEMLTGVPPFRAETPHAYLMLHSSERPRALRDVNPSVMASPELEALLFRALEKDRNKRFATAREFARALEQIMPSLADTPGEPPPLPVALEVTEEPTKPSNLKEMKSIESTPAGIDSHATTVQTKSGSRFEDLDLHTVPMVDAPAPSAPRRSSATPILLVLLLMSVAALGYMIWQKRTASSTVPVTQRTDTSTAVQKAPGHVGVNAFPWGEVTSIRNVASGASVHLPERLITPASIDLAPGRYEITLSNPQFSSPITKTFDVRAGEEQLVDVQFADPSTAALPPFQGATK